MKYHFLNSILLFANQLQMPLQMLKFRYLRIDPVFFQLKLKLSLLWNHYWRRHRLPYKIDKKWIKNNIPKYFKRRKMLKYSFNLHTLCYHFWENVEIPKSICPIIDSYQKQWIPTQLLAFLPENFQISYLYTFFRQN